MENLCTLIHREYTKSPIEHHKICLNIRCELLLEFYQIEKGKNTENVSI